MSEPIIVVENLSKKYLIGENIHRRGARTFRDIFDYKMRGIFSRKERQRKKEETTIWALKDVSFEVGKGEAVGIIGRNGAGKSTLLKILSRITEPTMGRVILRGRVASLLEVGTGFNLELTGRENIYLNGSILGMRKAEIDKRFDEIVQFAEIEKFLDTPVKRYSSGMYVRLAFAVAAHLEPEILLVDEVLAVGDAQFQKKCLGKMQDVSHQGRTVFFVSHNMGAVNVLCSSAFLLSEGEMIVSGNVEDVVARYLTYEVSSDGEVSFENYRHRSGLGGAYFSRLTFRNQTGEICNRFSIGDDITFDISIRCTSINRAARMSVDISSSDGVPVYHIVDTDAGFLLEDLSEQTRVAVTLKNQKLYPGDYVVSLWLGAIDTNPIDYLKDCAKFAVVEGGDVVKRPLSRRLGLVYETAEWKRIR